MVFEVLSLFALQNSRYSLSRASYQERSPHFSNPADYTAADVGFLCLNQLIFS